MNKKHGFLLLAAFALVIPNALQAQICGPFTDVQASANFCPFIFQIYTNGITLGTTATTYDPALDVTRDQMAAFLGRSLDTTLHRADIKTAMGKTWLPAASSAGAVVNAGGSVNDIVTDGTYLWIARADNTILKYNIADRRLQETWTTPRQPQKLGIFGGKVWVVDNLAGVNVLDPSGTPGATTNLYNGVLSSGSYTALNFDGATVWLGSAASNSLYLQANNGAPLYTLSGNVLSMAWDGVGMWVLQSDKKLVRYTYDFVGGVISIVDTVTMPSVTDCRMIFDGANLWIPDGVAGVVRVVHPLAAGKGGTIIQTITPPNVSFPYVVGFDGTTVMIGGVNNGYVAMYKATDLSFIKAFDTGLGSIRSIASDGRTFNVGDANGTGFIQF